MEKNSLVKTLTITFAVVAYLIGSGFATGQELLQYWVSYGVSGIFAIVIETALTAFMVVSFMQLGLRRGITNAHDVFTHYCGKYAGAFFEFCAFAYLVIQPVVYYTAVGATVEENYNMAPIAGAAIMGIMVILTVILGLSKLLDAIGRVGIVLIILIMSLSVIFLAQHFSTISEGIEAVKNIAILQPSKYWPMSGFLYATFNILGMAAVMPLIGANSKSERTNKVAGIMGPVIVGITMIVITLAFLADIGEFSQKMVPMVYLASCINPTIGYLYSIVVIFAVYTSGTPMFWSFCNRIFKEDDKRFKPLVIVLGAISVVIGANLKLDVAINIFYKIIGYAGAVFFIFVLVKEIQSTFKKSGTVTREIKE